MTFRPASPRRTSAKGERVLLHDILRESARRDPHAIAIQAGEQLVTYAALDAMINRISRGLRALGVEPGDRVGIWLEKSPRAVASMQAALRLGAAYVPIDPASPPARARRIIEDCAMKAVVTHPGQPSPMPQDAPLACLGSDWGAEFSTWHDTLALDADPLRDPPDLEASSLAYILYTSGSTGTPKGVCISHRNALAFIDWAHGEIAPTARDRFSAHAPFHFDLSVLDLYVAFRAGAAISLIPEAAAYSPRQLVELCRDHGLTVWYSVPSALILMMEHGGLLDADDLRLHTILFAGEPFPIQHLRRLHQRFPETRLLNLYGPTETNVCTFHEIGSIARDETRPPLIGSQCSGDDVWAVKSSGELAQVGEEGELWVSGPTVMLGYWGQEPHGARPYPTGDRVHVERDGNFRFLGRVDDMAKIRGHRVEPGEIEAALLDHPAIREAAVLVTGTGLSARLVAFLASAPDVPKPGLVAVKRHCSERLPRHMIVDAIRHVDRLPRTTNGKLDRRVLQRRLGETS